MAIARFLLKVLFMMLVILVVVGLILPADVQVERSIVIEAPAENVFPHINSMKVFNQWSPWAKLDPNTEFTFEGPSYGVGSKMSWYSTQANVASGSQTIVVSKPNKLVMTELDFGEEGSGTARLELSPAPGGTKVRWVFDTDFGWDLFGRYVGIFMDSMLGPSYDEGLANLKKRIEGA
ncbi:MAG: SRPBCC family protein [bacterium]